MERLHRLCRNVSMGRFHSSRQGVEIRKPNQRVQSSSASKLYWNPYRRGKSMTRKLVRTITLGTFALVAVLCAARPGRAADTKTPYPSMAPLDQHLMDRNAESAMARSAWILERRIMANPGRASTL